VKRQTKEQDDRPNCLERLPELIARIASNFVHLPPENVNPEIENALGSICECIDADLSTVLLWNDHSKSTLTVTHEWDAKSIGGPHFRGAVLTDGYHWLSARLREAEPLLISNLEEFPPEAAQERAAGERLGLVSIWWVPFTSEHGLEGYVALNTVNRQSEWPERLVQQFAIIGGVFANAIERQKSELELRKAHNEIRRLKERLKAENLVLREEIRTSIGDAELVGQNDAFRTVVHQTDQVASTDSTVLIQGETGTGKGLIARRIHGLSERRDRPLVTVNCAALPAALIESELFGHEKGAFTGSITRKIGRFEMADKGTIFLDEIGDLPLELQAKLLRVLQDHEFERLGSSKTRRVNTRVIAVTNRELVPLMENGDFRSDLYYRLSVFPIRVPPLRDRRDDIPLLVWYFIRDLQSRLGKRIETVTPRAMDALMSYDWPGNVRELRNIVERAMILSPSEKLDLGRVLPTHPAKIGGAAKTRLNQNESLESIERAHIVNVLEQCDWKVRGKDGAAERLGLKRTTLLSRMKKLGIQRPTV
jgi:transcriptional regulator with GAF, ATPase, and Fis domain